MKKVILLLLLLPYMATGQVIDNFESGLSDKWVQSIQGRWSADSAGALSGKYSLHHSYDNTETGFDRIGIPVINLHPDEGVTTWSFTVRHGYDPSSSNNWSVFLFSSAGPSVMSTDGSTNGFAIGVNLTGYDDTLRLWKVKGNLLTTVVNCRINWQTDIGTINPVKIKVERFEDGRWIVSLYRKNGDLIKSANGSDNELFESSWFGICYRYTSTRDRLLWIDDISIQGIFYDDITPPAVTGYRILGRKSISITLNEEPVSQFGSAENFFLNSVENKPLSVRKKSDLEFELDFANDFINKILNKLDIRSLCDDEGNCTRDTVIGFTPVWALPGDVIISEIMADPLPQVSLPGKEYLEITNRTDYSFNLKNWKLSSAGQNVLFPEVIILPSERRILCLMQDTILFSKYGKVTGLKQFPTLNDEGKMICLTDSTGTLIHGVEYSSDWYGDKLKSAGGWSLEMKDTKFPFYYEGNWIASSSRSGGTPGSVNSVSTDNPDTSFYGILNVYPEDSNTIIVRFSEPVINLSYDIRNIGIEGIEAIEILPCDLLFREFSVKTRVPLSSMKIYKFIVSANIKDFAGNRIQKGTFEFGMTEPSRSKDILFNELLFNPFPDDPDYIEFYNRSEKVIDASRLQLVSVNDDTGETSQPTTVSIEKRCILPGSYYAITTDKKKISDRYYSGDPDHIFEITYLPSMPDDKGHLILYNRELDKIDEVFYNDSLHNSLLSDNEGVALSKNLPQNSSEDARNWYSASESTGRGTPGALNFNEDLEAPVIKGCVVSGKKTVEIKLSEEPSNDFLSEINYSLNEGTNKPVSVIKKNNLLFRITFANELINRSLNNLTINALCDKAGNCSRDTVIGFTPVWALPGDVIISEIMADPLPEVSLPAKEYLEITNRTDYSFNLKNWKLSSEGQNVPFPEVIILPSERRILCLMQDTILFSKYGKVTGLKQFPTLTDEGKMICLTDSTGTLIHGVEYSSDWYGDKLKSAGGWSLEMKDTKFPFYYEGNWVASSSRSGGTPGSVNSVSSDNPDTSFYGILNVFPDDSNTIIVRFSEPLINLSYDIRNIGIEGIEAIEILPRDLLFREFSVKTRVPLSSMKIYKFIVSENIKDFAGNRIQKRTFEFGMTEPSRSKDILFNELLFNPFPDDPDYIEFYNRSEKVIDASRLQLASVNDDTGETSQTTTVSIEKRCILPGSYYAITTDKKKISDRYYSGDPDHIFEITYLPSMPDDKGHLILYNRELDKIDEVFYNDSLHNSLLSDNEGVALAKNLPQNSSEDARNWYSASESTGWGTPGALNFNKDLEAPVIKGCVVSGKNSVEIILSEEPSNDFVSEINYSINEGTNKPVSVIKRNKLLFRIVFANDLINRSLNSLIINTLCDKSGNCNSNIKISFTPVWALPGDVIISEIMADPVPQVSLPGNEYLEITNRSEYSFSLKNWKLISDGPNVLFPADTIKPADIIILCLLQDTSLFKKYGKVIGLKQFPTLTDAGKVICLTDSSGTLIHGVEYSSDWYGDDLKSAGGWSLEMIDLQFPFHYEGNWKPSSSRSGGTPGSLNSVAYGSPDISFYGVKNVYSVDSLNIFVRFSEPLIDFRNIKSSNIEGGPEIVEVNVTDPIYREFKLQLSSTLKSGEVYKIQFHNEIKDFAGNGMERSSFAFGLAETPLAGDILFNEIMFNPLPGDADYIELYNCSDKIIDASRMNLVYINEATSDTSAIVPVSPDKRCILPGTYYAITTDRQKTINRYISSFPENIYEISSLPTMPDDYGSLVLFSSELDVIDKVSYSEKMHYSLLSGFEGIALEKTGKCNSSTEAVNWHSATETSGWGTPGGPNSVYIESLSKEEQVSLSSTRITPDNDGFEDFLSISLAPSGNGNVVSVSVYDEAGRYVRKIASNMLTGAEVKLIWDGTADDGTPVDSGIYIVLVRLFDEKGRTEQWKKVCTVLR